MFQSTFRSMLFAIPAALFSLTTVNTASAGDQIPSRFMTVTTWEVRQVPEAIYMTVDDAEQGSHMEQQMIFRLIQVPVTKTIEVHSLQDCEQLPQLFSPLLRRLGWGDQNLAVELC